MSKKLSGSQFRKIRSQQEKFVAIQRGALLSFVHPQQIDNFHDLSELNEAVSNQMLIDVEHETANQPTVQNVSESEASVFEHEFHNIVTDDTVEELSDYVNTLSFNNPKTWLMYSECERAIYCFPCIVFKYYCLDCSFSVKNRPVITDPRKGFKDWKHLYRIIEHENSLEHKECYVKWKTFEKNLSEGNTIDQELQKIILHEKQKCRHILKVYLDSILFCAQNNIAFRGTNEIFGESNSGIFLKIIELISHYDTEIKHMIRNHKKGHVHYLSPNIQNEFIGLMTDQVRSVIFAQIKTAQYFSIMFDCTPDISHQEQMCEIIRYVHVSKENKVSVEERFIDIIDSHEKTGMGIAEKILAKLVKDDLDIMDARGQGYDNGSNMSGKYSGVQAHVLRINNLAIYVPCSAHSLNLAGVHAAAGSHEIITFFGTVQRLFTFFSSSVARWATLMSHLKVTLKKHADTRWSSKAKAVKHCTPSFVM